LRVDEFFLFFFSLLHATALHQYTLDFPQGVVLSMSVGWFLVTFMCGKENSDRSKESGPALSASFFSKFSKLEDAESNPHDKKKSHPTSAFVTALQGT
jgi:hypothetical protein